MERYVWCEDSGSGLQFWENIFSIIDDSIHVQSKGNNTRLRQASEKIYDDGNLYFIIIDCALDNPDVLRELKQLHNGIKGKKNVKVINIPSFEYALLSFEYLENWIFAETDALKEKRSVFLTARRSFVDIQENGGDSMRLSELKGNLMLADNINTEQLSAKLLYSITRNTGFETDKGYLGKCFYLNCCDWEERQQDDICGLDDNRKNKKEKMNDIVKYSILKQEFQRVGLL
jgi:hypothetical protein